MGYRIEFAVGGGVLRAVVSGRCRFAHSIARDISEQARISCARDVLIDVRRLQDRLGRLRELLAGRNVPRRIAVVDRDDNDRHYVFAELAATSKGCALMRFDSQAEALSWLYR
jgi:hypothetical protein